jgi:hypothetical protein
VVLTWQKLLSFPFHLKGYAQKDCGLLVKHPLYQDDLPVGAAETDDFVNSYLFQNVSEQVEFFKLGDW